MSQELSRVVLFLVDQVSKRSKRQAQRRMDNAGMGITVDQWVLLKVLEGKQGLSQRDLAQAAVRDPASITRSLDLLQSKALIDRIGVPGDRRQHQVVLTPLGSAFIRQHMELVSQLREESLKGFTTQEVDALQSMLKRMSQNFDE